jgi:hypothetical protein
VVDAVAGIVDAVAVVVLHTAAVAVAVSMMFA